MTFSELKKNPKKDHTGFEEIKFALLGDTATQFLAQAIQGYAYLSRLQYPSRRNFQSITRQSGRLLKPTYIPASLSFSVN